jgi:predicted kinase
MDAVMERFSQLMKILVCSTYISWMELPISELDKRCQKNNKVICGEHLLSVTK